MAWVLKTQRPSSLDGRALKLEVRKQVLPEACPLHKDWSWRFR